MSGQSITDRVMAAKHSIAGQGLAKAVHKSTTEEIMGPKRKHLDCLCMLNKITFLQLFFYIIISYRFKIIVYYY